MSSQEVFNSTYITSSEICRTLGVTRSALIQARNKGKLPEPILIEGFHISIWPRVEVTPYIESWKSVLEQRRQA